MEVLPPALLAFGLAVGLILGFILDALSKPLVDHPKRDIILPVAGIILGWLFAIAMAMYNEADFASMKTIGMILLAGPVAFAVASGKHTSSKAAFEQKLKNREEKEALPPVRPPIGYDVSRDTGK